MRFSFKKYEISNTEVENKIANFKGQSWKEHKRFVAYKKRGSSPKKPIWCAYEAVLFLFQHNWVKGKSVTKDRYTLDFGG